MIKVFQINVFFLCLLLFLFGCSEYKKDEGGMSASSQIKDPAELIKLAVSKQVTGTYDEPEYNVNPLSILTPGILRSIFESFFEGNNEDKITE